MSILVFTISLAVFFVLSYELFRTMFLVRRCAWCDKYLGLKLRGDASNATSHGICKQCVHRIQ